MYIYMYVQTYIKIYRYIYTCMCKCICRFIDIYPDPVTIVISDPVLMLDPLTTRPACQRASPPNVVAPLPTGEPPPFTSQTNTVSRSLARSHTLALTLSRSLTHSRFARTSRSLFEGSYLT